MRIKGRGVRFDKLPKIVKSCSFAGNQADPRTKWMPKVVGRWDEPQTVRNKNKISSNCYYTYYSELTKI